MYCSVIATAPSIWIAIRVKNIEFGSSQNQFVGLSQSKIFASRQYSWKHLGSDLSKMPNVFTTIRIEFRSHVNTFDPLLGHSILNTIFLPGDFRSPFHSDIAIRQGYSARHLLGDFRYICSDLPARKLQKISQGRPHPR